MSISPEIRAKINVAWKEKAEAIIRTGRVLTADEEADIIIEAYESAKENQQPVELSEVDDLRNYIMPLLTSLIGDELDAIHFKKQAGFECNPMAHKLAQAIVARRELKRESDTPSERELHLFTELGNAQVEIRGLRAALAGVRAGIWQPIETAPKDGTDIMVMNGAKDGYHTEAYQIGFASWCVGGLGSEGWFSTVCCDGVSRFEPVKWQPMPTTQIEDGDSNV